ncbi:S-adenosyl-L-methionine-dependent methyltransferase [Pseudomassariella vexata]|uniref:S-adenosyl-L-methionine-dependent methyltransferase n=1 Tax=Pseudomassariella vexata TaxID=1141098 RepID=A0A1Y2DUM4_9PEZI|nr:S-adenosyl-L-methionine-dependent methyltransferase [Pseudomassariella vexata]ORY62958.1 S-adenosyl-L-methionine-dependent methyltransferase [Pseudomassariella vexata]
MGRKNSRGGRKGGGPSRAPRGGGGAGGDRAASYRSYPDVVKEHEKLERYYNTIIPLDDDERVKFWDALKRELPNSFRFCGSKGHALAVKRLLETRYAPEIVKIERYDGQTVQAPQPISWYPDQLAYSMNTPKQVIRKFPPFAAFQKFLVSETSVGNISRQEIVSMIPPLLMDIAPGMTVLDLCAAPGSKAAQLLEMIHVGEEARVRKVMGSFGETKVEPANDEPADLSIDSGDDGRATGLLVANDADYKRSHMLVHQLKRLSSPNLLVTNHDATLYPSIRLPRDPANSHQGVYMKFDRILADVPCSGDGTLRKNMNLWKDWQPGNALGLHITQVRILVRALQMLKVGGRVVYSTCSMNPVENEAVVVSAIERCGGPTKVDIIDCSDRLTGLKRVPGMHQWSVMDKTGRIWNNFQEVQQFALTKDDGLLPGKVSETMFPRSDESDCSGLPLDRCMRVYAHQQDTGGFFITVLEKKSEIKAKPEATQTKPEVKATNSTGEEAKEEVAAKLSIEESKAAEGKPTDVLPTSGTKRPRESDATKEQPDVKKTKTETTPEDSTQVILATLPVPEVDPAKAESDIDIKSSTSNTPKPQTQLPERRKGPGGAFEEPFKYIPADHEVVKSIQSFYNISPRFPSDRYMVRNAMGEPAKAIYYTSSLVRDILVENEGRGMKFVHGGVKMFMKQDAPSAEVCRWRIQSEGMPIIDGYVGPERTIRLTNKETFHKLLKEMFPKFVDGDWVKLNEIGEQARDIGMGCCVLRVEPDGTDPDFSERIVLPLWKSFQSLNLMLPKEDRSAMLLRLYNDTTPVINQTLKEKAKMEANAEEAKPEVKDEKTEIHNGGNTSSEDGKTESSSAKVEVDSEIPNGDAMKLEEDDAENKTTAT